MKVFRITTESWILVAIGLADLITTLFWVHFHGAQEANPLFRHFLALGYGWFALMKVVFLAGPLLILEWARHHRPGFTRRASRFAIAGYLLLYVAGVAKSNPSLFDIPGRDFQAAIREATVFYPAMQHPFRPFERSVTQTPRGGAI
jgi:hypothetical protein